MTSILNKADDKLSQLFGALRANKKRELFASITLYTVLFAVYYTALYGESIANIGYLLGGDGLFQYAGFLTEVRRSLISFFGSIGEGDPAFPLMNFNYCYGSDNLISVFIDFLPLFPFYALSVFFPENMMPAFLTAGMTLLAYLSGLSFIALCSHFGKNRLIAALTAPFYIFCANVLNNLAYNPHFLYMTVAFPLMLVAMDRLIHGKSGVPFALLVTFLALGGIQLVVYTVPFVVVFAAVRVYYVHKGKYFASLGKYFAIGALYTVLGLMAAGFILLPFMKALLSGVRSADLSSVTAAYVLTPDIKSLTAYFGGDLGSGYDMTAFIFMIPLFLYVLISHRSDRELRLYGIMAAAAAVFPHVLTVLNGFQYDFARWNFIFSLIICCGFVWCLPKAVSPDRKETAAFVIILSVYILSYTFTNGEVSGIPLIVLLILFAVPAIRRLAVSAFGKLKKLRGEKSFIFLIVCAAGGFAALMAILFLAANKLLTFDVWLIVSAVITGAVVVFAYKTKKRALACSVMGLCAAVMGALMFFLQKPYDFKTIDPGIVSFYRNYKAGKEADINERSGCVDRESLRLEPEEDENGEDADAASSDTDETGETASEAVYNDNLLNYSLYFGYPDVQAFNSVMDGNYMRLLYRLGQDHDSVNTVNQVDGYSGKEVLYSLFGIDKFYTVGSLDIMYGTELSGSVPTDTETVYNIYENKYSLPRGVTYDRLGSEERFEAFDPAELPYAMMNEVWLDGYEGGGTAADVQGYGFEPEFELKKVSRGTTTSGIECHDNTITVKSDVSGCFLFMSFEGVVTGTIPSNMELLTVKCDTGTNRCFILPSRMSDFPWLYFSDHYTLELCYHEEDVNEITFISPFMYDSVRLYAVPLGVYTGAYEQRCAETLANIKTSGNTLTGEISLSSDKILSLSVLYSDGWTAYVDGKRTPLYRANSLFIGIPLTAGDHDIRLEYRTPLLLEGAGLTLSAAALMVTITIVRKKRR